MAARALALSSLLGLGLTLALGCSLSLGKEPFACDEDKKCPSGFTCQSTECVAQGNVPPLVRPMRVTFINAAEMYWFASTKGGATLVVNDGFSPGARGIYELHVTPEGTVSSPVELLSFDDEQPVSSAVVALDDAHYGVMTASFPNALSDGITVALHSLPREATEKPADTILFHDSRPYLGGSEPAYIGAVARQNDIVFAFTDPTQGGSVQVTSLSKSGAPLGSFSIPLPAEVLPLSGDCLLWKTADDQVVLRVGLNVMRVFTLDVAGKTGTPVITQQTGEPLYGFGDAITWLDENADETQATYVVRDLADNQLGTSATQSFQPGVEPYTGVPFGDGALIAPLATADDPDFKTLDVGFFTPLGVVSEVASFARSGDDSLYSARPFATDNHVYLAFTSFHDTLMDLWVGVTPIENSP